MSWILAYGLRFNRKSQTCVFFRWFALRFRVKTCAKNLAALSAICCWTRNQWNLLFSWTMKSAKYVFTRKSANQQKNIQGCDFLWNWRPHAKIQLIWTPKKNLTKIQHRMVMLQRLQMLLEYKNVNVLGRDKNKSTCTWTKSLIKRTRTNNKLNPFIMTSPEFKLKTHCVAQKYPSPPPPPPHTHTRTNTNTNRVFFCLFEPSPPVYLHNFLLKFWLLQPSPPQNFKWPSVCGQGEGWVWLFSVTTQCTHS